jgi:tRNA U34 2-thiouridine synthase MnmA/TrmU
VALLSGGLDSTLAVYLLLEQGVEVEALHFESVFSASRADGGSPCAEKVAQRLSIPLKIMDITEGLMEAVKNPAHGYGSNLNPCIDCRLLQLGLAQEYMKEVRASFIATGEVLGQRPMSQRSEALKMIDRQAGLEGQILRPLSAKRLSPTIPEEKGWVERERLLGLSGRSRKPQMALAKDYGLEDYSTPAGGCLLTDPGFSRRMRDLLEGGDFSLNDCHLLKLGRHFRLDKATKVIGGRDEEENKNLEKLATPGDLLLETSQVPGALVMLRGNAREENINLAARIAARYSKAKDKALAEVAFWKVDDEKGRQTLEIKPALDEEIRPFLIGL